MKKLESSLINMVLVLVGVALIMGGILAWVNHVTEGPIAKQSELILANGIKEVMGGEKRLGLRRGSAQRADERRTLQRHLQLGWINFLLKVSDFAARLRCSEVTYLLIGAEAKRRNSG